MSLFALFFASFAFVIAEPDIDLKSLKDRVLEMENQISKLTESNQEMSTKYSTLQTKYQDMEKRLGAKCDCSEIQRYQEPEREYAQQTANITTRPKRLLVSGNTNTRIAFHATLHADLINPGDNEHLEFQNVLLNEGDSYSGSTGTFTCSVPGTYVFFLTTLSQPNKWIQTEIVRNGGHLAYVYSYNDNHYDSGSNLVVVNLQERDSVWVRVAGNWHNSGDVMAAQHSAFSGFILWQNL